MNRKHSKINRILSLIVFGMLLVAAAVASQPAAGQGGTLEEAALRQAVLGHDPNAVITELVIRGQWARGATVEVRNGEFVVGEGTVFVAHWEESQGTVYWEGTVAFRHILPSVPDSLISAEWKKELDYEGSTDGTEATGYMLPWPAGTRYYISRAWSSGSCDHGSNAVDIVMPLNSPIVAAREGTVIEVTQNRSYCGCNSNNLNNRIRIQHDDGTVAWYTHIAKDSAHVSVGQRVCRGQWIANSHMIGYTCGSTQCPSWTTCPSCKAGAHLHFQVTDSAGNRLHVHFDDVPGGHVYGCQSYTSGNVGDATPPVTSHALSGTVGENGWYISPVQGTLTAQDGDGCGVKLIWYNVDGGGWQSQPGTSAIFTVPGDGGHTVYYKAEDNAGNQEGEKQATFWIDATSPANPTSADPHCAGSCSDPNFTWAGAGDTTSGVAGYICYWGTDSGGSCTNWAPYPAYDPAPVAPGAYYLRVSTKDNAGNVSACETLYTLQVTSFRIYMPVVLRSSGGSRPPTPTATSTPLPTVTPAPTATPAPVIVDNGDPGFYATDGWTPAANWTDCQGYGGDALWTHSRKPSYSGDNDYATWTPTMPQAGTYEVWVFIPRFDNDHYDTQHAFYKVYHAGGMQQIEISQAGNWCTWISLGTYSFAAGTGGYVRLGDYTGGEDPQRSVIADVVQFVWVSK